MSEGIKAQYIVLADLKKVDEKIARLQAEATRIPDELAKLDSAINAQREGFLKTKELFETLEKSLRKAEMDLREKEDKLQKAEGKMMEVKTNEEYQAAMKENQVGKDEKKGLEEQVLTLLNQVEERREKVKEAEQAFKAYEATISGDKKKLEEERTRIVNLIEEQLTQRSAVTSKLTPEVAELYQRIAPRIRGSAVIVADNGMCSGCNIRIRPQLYNEILGYKAIHRCPNCGRILISPQKDSAPATLDA